MSWAERGIREGDDWARGAIMMQLIIVDYSVQIVIQCVYIVFDFKVRPH